MDIEKIFKNKVPAAVYLKHDIEHADRILVVEASSKDDAIVLSRFIEKYLFENKHYMFSEYTSENSRSNDQIKKIYQNDAGDVFHYKAEGVFKAINIFDYSTNHTLFNYDKLLIGVSGYSEENTTLLFLFQEKDELNKFENILLSLGYTYFVFNYIGIKHMAKNQEDLEHSPYNYTLKDSIRPASDEFYNNKQIEKFRKFNFNILSSFVRSINAQFCIRIHYKKKNPKNELLELLEGLFGPASREALLIYHGVLSQSRSINPLLFETVSDLNEEDDDPLLMCQSFVSIENNILETVSYDFDKIIDDQSVIITDNNIIGIYDLGVDIYFTSAIEKEKFINSFKYEYDIINFSKI